MDFRQSGDERAGPHLAFAQTRGIGFVREANESGVEPAFENGAGLRKRREIEEVDGGFGKASAKALQHRRHERMKQSPNVSKVQLVVARFTGFARDTNGLLALFEYGLRLREKRPARFRELDSVVSAIEQRDAQFVFELANLPALGGLRNAEFSRRTREIEFTGHGGEVAQMSQFHELIMPGRHHHGNKEVLGENRRAGHHFKMKNQRKMDWPQCFAKRASLMTSSALRELMKVTAQPDFISFAGGLPATELFPVERVKSALIAALDSAGGRALQYSATQGLTELRDWIARRSRVKRENVLITSGAQQAMDLIGRILFEEGDRVIVENPTYLAALSAWRPAGVEFLPVASDAGGMCVDACDPLMKRKPKAIYCVPNFQNPLGTTLSLSRRKKLVALARRHSTAIIEDNPYGELRYSGRALPNLFELDARNHSASGLDSRVIYAGTFSKVLMPGLRVGWVIAARTVIEKLTQAKQAADLHTGTLSQHLALELVSRGFLDEQVPLLQANYRERRDVMIKALKKYFPKSATWTLPEGGMFLWVTLPRHINTGELLPTALKQRVAYVPGAAFHLNGEGQNTLRLNFSNARPERIETGIKKLGWLFKSDHF